MQLRRVNLEALNANRIPMLFCHNDAQVDERAKKSEKVGYYRNKNQIIKCIKKNIFIKKYKKKPYGS